MKSIDDIIQHYKKEDKHMKIGDQVRPIGFPLDSIPGTVRMAGSEKVAVTWTMGSGWKWTTTHDINELEVAHASNI